MIGEGSAGTRTEADGPAGPPARRAEDLETAFCTVLAEILQGEPVVPESDFFQDLGADSMLMARFCARVRKRPGLPSVSMPDVYRWPTARSLAASLSGTGPAGAAESAPDAGPAAPAAQLGPVSRARYLLCAVLQALCFLVFLYLATVLAGAGFGWVSRAGGLWALGLRALLFSAALLLGLALLPVLLKWVLIGRWSQREIQVWSLAYVRFWLVKTAIRINPVPVFLVGTPVYVLWLRALGARIGPGVLLLSGSPPICTDLVTIGAGSVLREGSFCLGYRAQAGRLQIGSVTLGRDVLVGEKAVLDIDTSMGDGAQLGHASTLWRGMAVPAGERWHGSPARGTSVDYRRVEPARCGRVRRLRYSLLTLGGLLILSAVLEAGAVLGESALPTHPEATVPTPLGELSVTGVALATAFLAGGLLMELILAGPVARLLSALLEPGRVYPLYGLGHTVYLAITRLTNRPFLLYLFGESSAVVPYLRFLGYDLGEVVQTGVNFGLEVRHHVPGLVTVGGGTMVADGLSVINADFSSTSFRVARATIGPDNFLGNNIAYPVGGRTGENCLLATKVMVPLDGAVRSGVGLLGSPPFEIPRTVERDHRFDHLRSGAALRRGLAAKNRYDGRTMAAFLLVRWLYMCAFTVLAVTALDLFDDYGHARTAAVLALEPLLTVAFFAVVERSLTFRPLQPRCCSIYDPSFWRHERLWKLVPGRHFSFFDGTPFKAAIWRLLGARVGAQVFDDGAYLTERSLVVIGDHATLNPGSRIQCHSQEDGTFKTDRSVVGADCTLGVAAHVHYGVTLGDGSQLAADSFLMKGEEVPRRALWGGNPAKEVTHDLRPFH